MSICCFAKQNCFLFSKRIRGPALEEKKATMGLLCFTLLSHSVIDIELKERRREKESRIGMLVIFIIIKMALIKKDTKKASFVILDFYVLLEIFISCYFVIKETGRVMSLSSILSLSLFLKRIVERGLGTL